MRKNDGWRTGRGAVVGLAAVVMMLAAGPNAPAQDAPPEATPKAGRRRPAAAGEGGNYAAFQLLRKGEELLEAGNSDDTERGAKILETIIEQYPADPIRFKAYLALGKHALSRSEQLEAIGLLRNLKVLEQPGVEMDPATRDLFLEGLYLQGIAYFQTKQYAQAFPLLRRITNDFPNTVWANQSYYYIGMCHFAQGNWNKAIESLGLVGTFVDDSGDGTDLVEAGRRFYVKIEDTDLPVLAKLGEDVKITITASSGDSETVPVVTLPGDGSAAIGSVPTALGTPKAGDGVLQVRGGDTLSTAYLDGNTLDGHKDVGRSREVKLVGTATVAFTRGDFESPATAAFQKQPFFVVLSDPDLDVSPQADKAMVRVTARFKEEEEEEESAASRGVDLEKILKSDEETWRTRDSITLELRELPQASGTAAPQAGANGPLHSGRFGGQAELAAFVTDQPVDQTDATLMAAIGDELVVTYTDERHIGGTTSRTVSATIVVAAEIDTAPRATQYEVADPVVAAKKNLVEGAAYLELGRIFKSMGLVKGAKEKVAEGLSRVEPIIRQSATIPRQFTEEAFRTKWDLHMVADELNAAISTCELFNRLFPESPFVDTALLQIGRIAEERGKPAEAIGVYKRVLALKESQAKAEAQYRIAQATEKLPATGAAEQAIVQYKLCAERYPDSPFAGEALGKLVDYHVEKKDNAAAHELLTQIFEDYPDAAFLDSMLLKWVMVAYRSGDVAKAHEKCTQLLFEYPESSFAERARAILPKIEAKLQPAANRADGGEQ